MAMIFYLFPRDTFVGIATYETSVIPDLEVTDGLPTNVSLLDFCPPLSLRLEIPSAANVVQALGYPTIASLGDAILNPHQWTFQFPLFLNNQTKSFLSFAFSYLGLNFPVAIWAIVRSPDQSEYTHFVSGISLLTDINFQVPANANGTLSLTFSSPFTHVFQSDRPYLDIMRPYAINERGLTIRDLKIRSKIGRDYFEKEITSLNINARRQINWHWTAFDSSRHSASARRAPNMFSATPILSRGSVTLGYPFNFSFLQAASIQPLQEVDIIVRDLFTLTLFGFKINSWGEDFGANTVGFTVNFSFINYSIS